MDIAESIEPPASQSPTTGRDMNELAKSHAPIFALEEELLKHPQVDLPIEHDFCNGLYARTMHIPEGTILTGAIHRQESFFLVRTGALRVTTDEGSTMLYEGDMCVSKIGTKRAGIAITDVVVTTFHANQTDEKDPDVLWDLYTIPPGDRLLEVVGSKKIGGDV